MRAEIQRQAIAEAQQRQFEEIQAAQRQQRDELEQLSQPQWNWHLEQGKPFLCIPRKRTGAAEKPWSHRERTDFFQMSPYGVVELKGGFGGR